MDLSFLPLYLLQTDLKEDPGRTRETCLYFKIRKKIHKRLNDVAQNQNKRGIA